MADPDEVLAAEKIAAEVAKLRAETKALLRPVWTAPSGWVPLLVAAGAIATTVVQYNVSLLEQEKNALAAQQKQLKAEREIDALKVRNDELSGTQRQLRDEIVQRQAELQGVRSAIQAEQAKLAELEANASPAIAQQVAGVVDGFAAIARQIEQSEAPVYIQFRGAIERDLVNDLRSKLAEQGFRAPGVERVAGAYASEVRFFREVDEGRASRIADAVTLFFADRRCPLPQPLRVRQIRMQAPAGSVEVWISHSCP
ncbi:hypothetical protein STVA_48990 [Allostella vacuolata]|nr:hypothetical protein STVA_48990 [Stella vacuolata]